MQYKTSEVRSKCSGLMRVNIYKDRIKTTSQMPPLPNDKALFASLRPAYNILRAAGQERARGRPMYAISEEQKKAAETMLQVSLHLLTYVCHDDSPKIVNNQHHSSSKLQCCMRLRVIDFCMSPKVTLYCRLCHKPAMCVAWESIATMLVT